MDMKCMYVTESGMERLEIGDFQFRASRWSRGRLYMLLLLQSVGNQPGSIKLYTL